MNDQRPYGALPSGASRLKRKDREPIQPAKRPPPPRGTTLPASTGSKGIEVKSSNKLLAGYMAYEFLTKGTLLGQQFGRSETADRGEIRAVLNGNERYKEITNLLMMKTESGGGDHIAGIVSPTELVRWIDMKL